MFLGSYPAELFVEEEAKAVIRKMRETLEKILSEIEERNQDLEVPYEYLLPSKIPNSINI